MDTTLRSHPPRHPSSRQLASSQTMDSMESRATCSAGPARPIQTPNGLGLEHRRENPSRKLGPQRQRNPGRTFFRPFTLKLNSSIIILLLLAAVLAVLASLTTAAPTNLAAGWTYEDIITNAGIATDFVFLPDERLLVVLKAGRILMVKGKKVTGIAADLTQLVGRAYGDRGVVGISVHPQFGTGVDKDWVYIGYVWDGNKDVADRMFGDHGDTWGGNAFVTPGPKWSRLSRFTMKNDTIDPTTEVILLSPCASSTPLPPLKYYATDCAPMIGSTHSVDWIEFGPDGNLWVSVGDGQAYEGTDWFNWVDQDFLGPMSLDYLPGKILRLDENGRGVIDNPFYNGDPDSPRSKIWATGLRQPWRCSFVPGTGTGAVNASEAELLCGNVGWYTWETVYHVTKGSNLGWPCMEGPEKVPWFIYNNTKINPDDHPSCAKYYSGATTGYPRIQHPVYPVSNTAFPYSWNHEGKSSAIIGGVFVPGGWFAEGKGKDCYVIADFVRSGVYCLPWDYEKHTAIGYNPAVNGTASFSGVKPVDLAQNMDQPVTFRIGPDGNLWVLGHCTQCASYGVLRRLIPPEGNTTLPYGTNVTIAGPGSGNVLQGPTLSGAACFPSDKPKIVVPELPQGWEQIMYMTRFPNVRYYRNGLGPVEVDASVGGAEPLDGTVMSVAGVWYMRGMGTRTTSEVHLPTLGYCHRLYVEVGLDDQTGLSFAADAATQNRVALGEYVIKADGQVLFNLSARMGTYMRAGDLPQTIDLIHLEWYSDLGLYGYKPWGNAMNMDATLNFLDWGEAKMYCGPDSPYLPAIDITYPESKNLFGLNDQVVFSGIVSTYDDKPLPEASYQWYINLIHCQGSLCHTHFYENFQGVKNGVFNVEPHGLTSSEQFIFYEIKLVGTDLCGRSNFAVRNVLVGDVKAQSQAATPLLPPGKMVKAKGTSKTIKGLFTDRESLEAGYLERATRARNIAHYRNYEYTY